MASALQPFLISEFQTGLSTYLQPWIRPRDAFDPLVNAYTYRGVLNKRNGSVVFGNQLADTNPVMGIMQRINENDGSTSLIVASTTNAYLYNPGSNTFIPQVTVGGSASVFWQGTATGTKSIPTFWPNFANGPGTVMITDGTTTVSFASAIAGVGAMTGAGGIFASGSLTYATGVVSITFAGTTTGVSLSISGTLATGGAYFTGNNTNFFNWVSWQASDSAPSYLYMTNNVDPVTLFDGTNLSRPVLYVDTPRSMYITNALDVLVYQNRLLLLRPTILTATNANNQSIAWSAQFNPLNFINDTAGNGGLLTAATGDIIQCQESLRNTLIVFFTNSVWNFRFTGSFSDPFRWDKITISKTTNAPYASVPYDERCTAIGSLGLIACDGTNVQRYDTSIIDYYETEINESYFGQCFAQRYDNLNQTWMLYISTENTNPVVGMGAPGSDSALIYNFAEQTWCTYTFSVPMTCLGKFFSVSGTTWEMLTQSWESTDVPWNSYGNQKLAPILLGGDVNGNVYWLDNNEAVTDQEPTDGTLGVSFLPDIKTTRWNPVLQTGQKTQFAYIDIYYSTVSTDPTNPVQLTLTFYVDNSNNVALTRILTLDGPSENTSDIIDVGNGGSSYSGTIESGGYIIPYSLDISAITSEGLESFQDNGSGILIGSLGDTGTINYNTEDWTISLTGRTIPTGNPITANYDFNNPENSNFKRIYCNLVGEFVQMDIDPNVDAAFQILGFIIWARPAGRLTPGLIS